MTVGPLRRITAALGLVVLAPITWLLVIGALTPEEAAIRALVVVATVVTLGNLIRAVLTRLLRRVERRAEDEPAPDVVGVSGRANGPANSAPSGAGSPG